MPVKVGIPRALLYYYFYPQWLSFFQHLGVEPVVSHQTTRGLLEKGLRSTVDEACLPVKLAVGHVLDLKDRVDYLFLPRLVSMARREYICPKFLGFPDMVRNTIDNLPPVININLDLYRKKSNAFNFFQTLGKLFTKNPARIYMAYRASCQAQNNYWQQLETGLLPDGLKPLASGTPSNRMADITIAVIGHPYNIYDRFISMDMIKRLGESGVSVVTADRLSDSVIRQETARLPKQLFWTLNQRMIGAAYHYFNEPEIHGLIHVASFGCGPDSMTGELIERFARSRSTKPLLVLTLDEHTGEAGMVTRLEAFLDMVRWRRNLADVAVTL